MTTCWEHLAFAIKVSIIECMYCHTRVFRPKNVYKTHQEYIESPEMKEYDKRIITIKPGKSGKPGHIFHCIENANIVRSALIECGGWKDDLTKLGKWLCKKGFIIN